MPTSYQGTLFRSSGAPILNLTRPEHVTREDQRAQLDFLQTVNGGHLQQRADERDLLARIQSFELAYRMQMEASALCRAFSGWRLPRPLRRAERSGVPRTLDKVGDKACDKVVKALPLTLSQTLSKHFVGRFPAGDCRGPRGSRALRRAADPRQRATWRIFRRKPKKPWPSGPQKADLPPQRPALRLTDVAGEIIAKILA